jgi:uncharacterized membrane protein
MTRSLPQGAPSPRAPHRLASGATDGNDAEAGTILILLIFFVVIVAGLITVVVDVSTMFIATRGLQGVADGAVSEAAQGVDVGRIYGAPVGTTLPLTQAGIVASIQTYVDAPAHWPHECASGSVQIEAAALDGDTVAVALSCAVPLPFVKLIDESAVHRIHASAHARLVVTRPSP